MAEVQLDPALTATGRKRLDRLAHRFQILQMGMGMDQKHSNTHFEIWRHPSASSLYHGISWARRFGMTPQPLKKCRLMAAHKEILGMSGCECTVFLYDVQCDIGTSWKHVGLSAV